MRFMKNGITRSRASTSIGTFLLQIPISSAPVFEKQISRSSTTCTYCTSLQLITHSCTTPPSSVASSRRYAFHVEIWSPIMRLNLKPPICRKCPCLIVHGSPIKIGQLRHEHKNEHHNACLIHEPCLSSLLITKAPRHCLIAQTSITSGASRSTAYK